VGTGPSFERPSVELAEEHAQRTNPQHAMDRPMWVAPGRGLHSSTLQLNLSAFCVTGGAVRGCFGGV